MNGTVIFGGVILFFIISGLVTFINELHDDVDTSYSSKKMSHAKEEYSQLYTVNMYGEMTLVLTGLSERKKIKIWKESLLLEEMLKLFPNFTDMKRVVENRLVDDGSFKDKLLEKIMNIEDRYIGGLETGESARASLSQF